MKLKLKFALMLLALSGSAFAAAPEYKLVDTIKIGGAAKWDYVYLDSDAHRLYVTHGDQTEVVDTKSNKVVGTIADTAGSHGVAIAKELGIGFVTTGGNDSVAVFDLASLKITSSIKVGSKPDAIIYSRASHKVVAFNGHSNNVSIIDVNTMKVVATVALPGNPEFSVLGADGHVYFNLEDAAKITSIDLTTNTLKHVYSLKPCEEPTGLAMDVAQNLFSVCKNNLMMITSTSGKNIAKIKIGSGPDGVAYLDGYAFSANGADGNMTVVGLVDGKFQAVATIPTQIGARTIAADPLTHTLYLPTADFQPADGKQKRQFIADTFRVLVFQKQ